MFQQLSIHLGLVARALQRCEEYARNPLLYKLLANLYSMFGSGITIRVRQWRPAPKQSETMDAGQGTQLATNGFKNLGRTTFRNEQAQDLRQWGGKRRIVRQAALRWAACRTLHTCLRQSRLAALGKSRHVSTSSTCPYICLRCNSRILSNLNNLTIVVNDQRG